MFEVREVSAEELMESMLYWQRDIYFGRGLINDEGLQIVPTPSTQSLDDDKPEWHETYSPSNSWHDRRIFGFSLLDDLTRRK